MVGSWYHTQPLPFLVKNAVNWLWLVFDRPVGIKTKVSWPSREALMASSWLKRNWCRPNLLWNVFIISAEWGKLKPLNRSWAGLWKLGSVWESTGKQQRCFNVAISNVLKGANFSFFKIIEHQKCFYNNVNSIDWKHQYNEKSDIPQRG